MTAYCTQIFSTPTPPTLKRLTLKFSLIGIGLDGQLASFNGDFNPKLHLQDYADLFAAIHQRYPELANFMMTAAEFIFAYIDSKICRLYLYNFKHIRTSVLTRNEGGLVGLRYGADDFDLPTEDEVTQKAGATISHDFAKLLAAAEAQGFTPVRRESFAVE